MTNLNVNWTVRLAKEAAKQLKDLLPEQQELIRKRLREMAHDPFQGDVKALKGRWKGRYRKRAGRYRIIFIPLYREQVIEISAILLRTERTYD